LAIPSHRNKDECNVCGVDDDVHGIHDVRQMDIHTAEPLLPEPTLVEVEICYWKVENI
jgi:hypothetical protein